MENFKGKKNIIWDFDGVLIDSHQIREAGFIEVLSEFPGEEIRLLLDYHRRNGGLSRYVKFQHFFRDIRKVKVSPEELNIYAEKFSEIMKSRMTDKKLLIRDSLDFVKANYHRFQMHIISGSDGQELRFLCKELGIDQFFKSIQGSPTPKIQLVSELLKKYKYESQETLLIGDSINDFEAAEKSNVDFFGYNNLELRNKGRAYLTSFETSGK